ncbi:MAG: LuxR C-terminal-related transcriptional regulator [Candidatus Levybacteria bacterium]|nr:LuxR C-terminal-related transcriptional regulator [Candidatus Levybacteria bacterium]
MERFVQVLPLREKEIVKTVSSQMELVYMRSSVVGRKGEVLNLISCGLSNDDIAEKLGIKNTTVKTYFDRLQVDFGTHSRINLAFKAMDVNILDVDLLAQNLNFEKVKGLTEAEKIVLDALVQGQGEDSSNHEIAFTIGKSHHTVRSQLNKIFIKLGVENKTGAGIAYIIGKKRGLV